MVENIAVAMETVDTGFLNSVLDAESTWTHPGGSENSAAAIVDTLKKLRKPTAVTIDQVTSHGKVGAANGHVKRGNSQQRFCHVIEFTTTKCNRVRRIESYGPLIT